MSKIIDFTSSYTFSQYFNLPQLTEEIVAEFGYEYERDTLALPEYKEELSFLEFLQRYIRRNQRLVNPRAEISIREFLIAPILVEVCDQVKGKLYSEYSLIVNDQLKGTLDYYLKNNSSLLVIEAKQADIKRGFTQLAVELIALDKSLDSDRSRLIYGAVTNGEGWRFGVLNRESKEIFEDVKLYQVPEELENLVRVLVGILSGT